MNSTIKIVYLLFISFTLILTSCKSLEPVDFNTPVDTNNRPIHIQQRKTFRLEDVGVYASNEFDGARLNGFEKENDSTALVIISPENTPINHSPYYGFTTWSNSPKTFYFKFKYQKPFKHRYTPKLKINGAWHIIDTTDIFKEDSITIIKLNLSTNPITVAAQEIQSANDVKNWYTTLVNGKNYIKIRSVGKSTDGRNLPVLDIFKGSKKNKPTIILLTRQHPPETTGYYAFQGFLQTILDDSALSDQFLNKYNVLAFPIMNPDGVDLGHWRHNAGGVDLNRDWAVYNQPEIRQVVKFINNSLDKNNSKLVLGLDFHSTWYDVFYTNENNEGTALPDFTKNWFTALEENIPGYIVNEKSAVSNKPVSKGWFLKAHNAVGITYEIGDATPKDKIKLISSVSAKEMMRILLKE